MSFSLVSLEYKHEIVIDDNEPSFYIKNLEGHVLAYDGIRRERIGRFRVFVIDVELAVNERYSVFEVFDHRSETIGYWSLYKPNLDFKTKVVKVLQEGERWQPNMLILDRMEIFPKHRGKGIGLNALRCLQQQFSTGCGIVAMKPFPLQFEGGTPRENKDKPEFVKLGLGTFDPDLKRATAKLRAHYARLGFARVPGTDYMVADPMLVIPSLSPE